jgi:flagellin-like hook-associated protein FlgL
MTQQFNWTAAEFRYRDTKPGTEASDAAQLQIAAEAGSRDAQI